MCLFYEIPWLLCSYPPPPLAPKIKHFFPGFGFFVKIPLVESSKLDFCRARLRERHSCYNFSLVYVRASARICLDHIGGGRVVRWCWINFQCRGVLQVGLQ